MARWLGFCILQQESVMDVPRRFRAPLPTRMTHRELSVNTRPRVKWSIELGSIIVRMITLQPAGFAARPCTIRSGHYSYAHVYLRAATHLRQVWGSPISAVYCRAAEWVRQSAQECGRNQQTPTPRAASRISRCNHRNLYLNHPNTLLITAFRWISTRSILKANLLD